MDWKVQHDKDVIFFIIQIHVFIQFPEQKGHTCLLSSVLSLSLIPSSPVAEDWNCRQSKRAPETQTQFGKAVRSDRGALTV